MPVSLSRAASPWSSGAPSTVSVPVPGSVPGAYHANPRSRGLRFHYTLAEWSQLHSRPSTDAGGVVGLSGLGATAADITISASKIANAAVPATLAITHASVFGLTAAVAVPVIGAVIAGVTLALVAIFSRKGPAQKVATTEIVNKIEPLLQQNLAGYLAGPHTVSSQAQALANFDAGWAYVSDYCGVPEMGNPGQACVSDRQRGGTWDWFSYYRDPIANDANVVPDPVVDEVGNLIDTLTGGIFTTSGGTGSGTGWLLLAGLAVAGVFLLGDSK